MALSSLLPAPPTGQASLFFPETQPALKRRAHPICSALGTSGSESEMRHSRRRDAPQAPFLWGNVNRGRGFPLGYRSWQSCLKFFKGERDHSAWLHLASCPTEAQTLVASSGNTSAWQRDKTDPWTEISTCQGALGKKRWNQFSTRNSRVLRVFWSTGENQNWEESLLSSEFISSMTCRGALKLVSYAMTLLYKPIKWKN